MIEDALFMYTNEHPLVVGHELLTGFINLNIERPIVAKIHRSLYFHPLNRQNETDGLAEEWQKTLKNVLQVYTPVVIGYGGGDQSLMRFLKESDTKMNNGLFWCYWDEEEPSEEIKQLVQEKKGCFVPIEGFDRMMYVLSEKLNLKKDPEQEMRDVTEKRIQLFNQQRVKNEEVESVIHEESKNKNEKFEGEEGSNKKEGSLSIKLKEAQKKLEKEKTADNYFELAYIYKKMNDYAGAIKNYTKAIEMNQKYSEAYFNRGNAYLDHREYIKAIDDYTKVIELTPEDAAAYFNRGFALHENEEYLKAIEDYTRVIELTPEDVAAYFNRGLSYNKNGELLKAIADYTKAIELNPKSFKAYHDRGLNYKRNGEYLKAIEDYTKAIELNPKYFVAYNNRGVAYDANGEYEKGIADYTKAIEFNPKYVLAYKNRAIIYEKLGEDEKAAQDRETAQRLENASES